MHKNYPLLWQKDLSEKECMERSLLFYRPRPIIREAILAAYNDKTWDWDLESDGCTGVDECYYPRHFRHPACVAHDYLCYLARQGLITRRDGDRLFRWAMLDYQIPPVQAWVRWLGVRLYWLAWGQWR